MNSVSGRLGFSFLASVSSPDLFPLTAQLSSRILVTPAHMIAGTNYDLFLECSASAAGIGLMMNGFTGEGAAAHRDEAAVE